MIRRLTRLATVACLFAGAAAAADSPATRKAAAPVEDFSFTHFSDVHVSPHLHSEGPAPEVRGAETIAWLCREAVGPQSPEPFDAELEAPAFAIATGDLTEFGVIDDTWSIFERAFEKLPYPVYVTPGNHDNTWVAMYHVMRQRHGGVNYSVDRFGCHFVFISSASPQEPVPTIDATTRSWLEKDLSEVSTETPVFIALHHPPYGNEFASPVEYDTLIDTLRNHNVVLMLYGHGHGVSHRDMDGIDGVMGGSTFGKHAGYGVVGITEGKLRVAYRFHRDGKKKEWKALLEKPLPERAPPRLFTIEEPAYDSAIEGDVLRLRVKPLSKSDKPRPEDFKFFVDGEKREGESVGDGEGFAWRVDAAGLPPGEHLLTVRLAPEGGAGDLRTRFFRVPGRFTDILWRRRMPAAVKAAPVVVGEYLVIARTDGRVKAVHHRTGEPAWHFHAGAEILGGPALARDTLVFGSGDGWIYALDTLGKPKWRYDVGRPVYGVPLIDGDLVFIGDNGGRLHALRLEDGKPAWTFERADYAIEAQPAKWGNLIVFGAWDGQIHAIHREDGSLAWKAWGPKSSEGKAARYYAPADCGPVVAGDSLFLCDRGYVLARYDRDGTMKSRIAEGVSGIAGAGGDAVYARGTGDRLIKYGADGSVMWEAEVPAGRFPNPPTVVGDRVYVCSNTGRLSVLDAKRGQVLGEYQVTPGSYVMAPVAVDDHGVCYVAGMDGTLCAVRFQERGQAR